jgi:hypothetical protein
VRVEFDPDLARTRHRRNGGLTAEEVRQIPQPPRRHNPYDSIGGDGEGDWALFLRAGQALHKLLRPPGQLPHRFARRVIEPVHARHRRGCSACDPSGVRFRFENTSFSRVIYFPHQHRWAIDAVNDRAHLKSLENRK